MSDYYQVFSYDDTEIDQIVSTAAPDLVKVCFACNKPFLPNGRNAWRMKFCQRQHYIKCKICGNLLDIVPNKGIPNTCSKACNDLYYKCTLIHGVVKVCFRKKMKCQALLTLLI